MLTDDQLYDLYEFMSNRPTLCDHTLTYTKVWLESRDDLDAKYVLGWIRGKGSKCDCEVFLNIAIGTPRSSDPLEGCPPEARKNIISEALLEMSEEFKDLQDKDWALDGLLMLRKWVPWVREDVRTKLEDSIADLEARMMTEVK